VPQPGPDVAVGLIVRAALAHTATLGRPRTARGRGVRRGAGSGGGLAGGLETDLRGVQAAGYSPLGKVIDSGPTSGLPTSSWIWACALSGMLRGLPWYTWPL
jgi:hypothetical protein